jgi:hypothetical protein
MSAVIDRSGRSQIHVGTLVICQPEFHFSLEKLQIALQDFKDYRLTRSMFARRLEITDAQASRLIAGESVHLDPFMATVLEIQGQWLVVRWPCGRTVPVRSDQVKLPIENGGFVGFLESNDSANSLEMLKGSIDKAAQAKGRRRDCLDDTHEPKDCLPSPLLLAGPARVRLLRGRAGRDEKLFLTKEQMDRGEHDAYALESRCRKALDSAEMVLVRHRQHVAQGEQEKSKSRFFKDAEWFHAREATGKNGVARLGGFDVDDAKPPPEPKCRVCGDVAARGSKVCQMCALNIARVGAFLDAGWLEDCPVDRLKLFAPETDDDAIQEQETINGIA